MTGFNLVGVYLNRKIKIIISAIDEPMEIPIMAHNIKSLRGKNEG